MEQGVPHTGCQFPGIYQHANRPKAGNNSTCSSSYPAGAEGPTIFPPVAIQGSKAGVYVSSVRVRRRKKKKGKENI
jgi:hypothetical protein